MHQRTAASNRGPSARQVDDGAVFWMDPTKAPAGDSVVAQLTVSTGTASRGVFSAQGKSKAGAEDWDICCISFDTGAAGGGGGGDGGGVKRAASEGPGEAPPSKKVKGGKLKGGGGKKKGKDSWGLMKGKAQKAKAKKGKGKHMRPVTT